MSAEMVDRRTGEIIPARNAAAIESLAPADREVAVTGMLSEARQWLAHAVETTAPQRIAEFKAFVATIAESTKQLNLSREIQLDAQEMVRRAERGVGLAIRRGQEAGEIRTRGSHEFQGNQHVRGELQEPQNTSLASPYDFASHSDLYGDGKSGGNGVYALTDGVSAEQFEQALGEAKSEGNLSRANVVRKVKGGDRKPDVPTGNDMASVAAREGIARDLAARGHTSAQIAARLGISEEGARRLCRRARIEVTADKVMYRSRRIDSAQVAAEIVATVAELDLPMRLVNFAELDPTQADEWANSLTESIRALNRFAKQMKELANEQG